MKISWTIHEPNIYWITNIQIDVFIRSNQRPVTTHYEMALELILRRVLTKTVPHRAEE